MLISDLDTPALIVDLDVMDRNLARVAGYCREHQLRLRPHTKTHKIPELAKRQIASGAAGITDILIAYPIVGPKKTTRLAHLAEQASISVSLDSQEVARGLSEATTRA